MAGDKKRGANEPEPRPIIVKKIIVEGHGGHHGGAWKVAYADFVTAMMAFFLLMWLLGATTEKQRKALADYFTPTLVELKMASAGSTGLMGGDSIMGKEIIRPPAAKAICQSPYPGTRAAPRTRAARRCARPTGRSSNLSRKNWKRR